MYLEEEARLLPAVPSQRLWVPSVYPLPFQTWGSSHEQGREGPETGHGRRFPHEGLKGAGGAVGVLCPKYGCHRGAAWTLQSWPCRSQPGP